jgi:hypothetical protein
MDDLFRSEALEHHAGRPGGGDVLRLTPRWANRLFWILLVLVLAGLAASWLVRVDGQRLLWILLGRG